MNIFVFNSDLRLKDNPALYHSSLEQRGLAALYFVNKKKWDDHDDSNLKIKFQLKQLRALRKNLEDKNISLLMIEANGIEDEAKLILEKAKEIKAKKVFINSEYGVNEKRRDSMLERMLNEENILFESFDTSIIHPSVLKTKTQTFFKVFTPYSKAFREALGDRVLEVLNEPIKQDSLHFPAKIIEVSFPENSIEDEALKLYPIGEDQAQAILNNFIKHKVTEYKNKRDFPGTDGTSMLSPYLTAGIISAKICLSRVFEEYKNDNDRGIRSWVNEILWREFYKYILFCFPEVSKGKSFIEKYDSFEWSNNEEHFNKWKEGKTGVPIVDAAMQQLNKTGWMHNRLRMVVAMYLTKNLLIDWRKGEKYFMSKLIDGDLASNNGGWQWSASTGVDAAPYFRIFNPITQSEKFDPDGKFIRKWVPELNALSPNEIHNPSEEVRKRIGYHLPLVDLGESRKKAIEAFSSF